MLKTCKCGTSIEPELINKAFGSNNREYYYYKCSKCEYSAGLGRYPKLAKTNWNRCMQSTNTTEGFSCRMKSDLFIQMSERSLELGLSKSQFAIDAIREHLERVKEFTRSEYIRIIERIE
jgi:hypothetical protein